MAMPRTIAIGDIHGCLAALEAILAAIRPRPDDTLLTMGDYIDRGPDSRGVIERLLRLGRECRLIPLLGNHDEMLLKLYDGQTELYIDWLLFGGNTTLGSYGSMRPEDIPPEHIGFLPRLPAVLRDGSALFRAWQLSGRVAAGGPTGGDAAVGLAEDAPTRPALFGQDGHRGPRLTEERRDSRPRLRRVHRHVVLWRRLAHGTGRGKQAGVAGG